MTSFLRLAFLMAFFAQIFVVNSQDIFADKLQSIDEKFDKQFKILIDQIQQQQLQFEKFFKGQAEQAEKLANMQQQSKEILFELTQQGKEKQQEIESLHEKLKAEQLILNNLNESLQNCTQNSAQLEEKFDQKTIERDQQKSDQNLTKNLEQELLRSSNISAQLQICNQNSTKIIQELKIEKLKLEEALLLQPCEFFLNHANTDQGIFQINLNESGLEPFDVNCQRIDEEAWLIIQRRQDGSENFNRNLTDYKNGFGDLDGEFWLGLEKLHQLTKNHEWQLKIWLKDDSTGKEGFGRYKKFKVGNETEEYKLNVGEFSGNVRDKMAYQNGHKYSTQFRHYDEGLSGLCATLFKGAWWFEDCAKIDLNGDYNGNDKGNFDIYWDDFDFTMKYSQMAIRRLI